MIWSWTMELDRGGSTSKDEKLDGCESDRVQGDMEKDPKIGVGLDLGVRYAPF